MGNWRNSFIHASALYFLIELTGQILSTTSPSHIQDRDQDLLREYDTRITNSKDYPTYLCDDFYTHVCGRAQNDSSLTPNFINSKEFKKIMMHKLREYVEVEINPDDSEIERKIKQQVEKCKNIAQRNADGIEWLRFKIETNGDWPMAKDGGSWNPDNFHILETQKYESSLFVLRVAKNNIYIDRYGLSVYGKFLSNLKFKEKLRLERHYETLVKRALNFYTKDEGKQLKWLDEDITAVMEFRRDLHNLARFKSKDVKAGVVHLPITVQALQALVPTMNDEILTREIRWLDFLQNVFKDTDFQVTGDTIVYIDRNYIEGLLNLLRITPVRTIANHIQLHFFESYMGHTSFQFYELSNEMAVAADFDVGQFHENYSCLDFPQIWRAFNYFYIKKWFPDSSRKAVGDMIIRIKSALREEINRSLMMDNEVKSKAKEILYSISVIVGSDIKYVNYELLAPYYTYATNSYLPMIMNAHEVSKNREFKSITMEPRDILSEFPVLEDEVSYSVRDLRIKIPLGYLHRTNLSPTLKPELSYATLGQVMSSLLNEAILVEGAHPVTFGRKLLESTRYFWYGKEKTFELENRINCFMRQYDGRSGDESRNQGQSITSNDNDAWKSYVIDNMAFQTSFMAYKDLLLNRTGPTNMNLQYDERDDAFIYAYANRHCVYRSPDADDTAMIESQKHRVNTLFGNSHIYQMVMKCDPSAPMNLEHRCKFWENTWSRLLQ